MTGERVAEHGPRRARTRRGVDIGVVLVAATLDYIAAESAAQWRWGGVAPQWSLATLVLLGALPLLGRRRHPQAAFVATWVYACSRMLLVGIIPFAPPLVALQALAARSSPRRARVAAVSMAIPFGFCLADGHHVREGDWFSVGAVAIASVLLVVAAHELGRREKARVEQARLDAARTQAVAAEALAAERRRIARELHDNLGHAITAMTLQAAGARAVSTAGRGAPVDPRVVGALSAIEETGATAMRELHRLLGVLRTHGDVEAAPLAAPGLREIEALAAGARSGGLEVTVSVAQDESVLDASVEYAIYRVVQEGIANAMRHDGPGSVVTVDVGPEENATRVRVTSRAPRGAAPCAETDSGGFGLPGLRERVVLIGGRFEAGPRPGGFVTTASFPR